MRQLILELPQAQPFSLEGFIAGSSNAELMQRLQLWAGSAETTGDRSLYLWGEAGSGKSHLLQALTAATNGRYLSADSTPESFDYSPDIRCYVLDDCERLSPASQIAAFNLFNQVRERGGVLAAAGAAAPAQLAVREDLRTRLGWGLIYQLHSLSDAEKIAALETAAAARGVGIASGVLPYLITHFQRDMRSLSAMLDALDRYSLETKRPITLPLLRSLLQLESEETSS
ncbi:DnaA regulatory inactivator Hda [Herbaspirillum sp. RTI4]|uniref:DnaA regulatory inactivator Hda n=1 Tax=Herbaspirillum sp. RTI4 TaxID=3048640 RepID=UPI002AB48DF8|nr:DnaA regulatory inactivator Hda [Herbaspirillum sp. RTI4]MDY7576842.1 DnaA regulatory inactivator Hda [Herbaspirillum sp. RTI4]MEA9983357.1 DnaA regulatory inactivator Hda [Herbaspirillum sp. RTI4]